MRQKRAYSFAELCAAMVILGVIAIIVLTNMNTSSHVAQLHSAQYDKVYNDVDTASKSILTLDRKNSVKFNTKESAALIRDSFSNHMDISNSWEGSTPGTWSSSDSDSLSKLGKSVADLSGVTLNNGVKVGFISADDEVDAERIARNLDIPYNVGGGLVGALIVDLNGNSSPNKDGDDQYIIPLCAEGVCATSNSDTTPGGSSDGPLNPHTTTVATTCAEKSIPGSHIYCSEVGGTCSCGCFQDIAGTPLLDSEGFPMVLMGNRCVSDCTNPYRNAKLSQIYPKGNYVINYNSQTCYSCSPDVKLECLNRSGSYEFNEVTCECDACDEVCPGLKTRRSGSCACECKYNQDQGQAFCEMMNATFDPDSCSCICKDANSYFDGNACISCGTDRKLNASKTACECLATATCGYGSFDSNSCECSCQAPHVSNGQMNSKAACECSKDIKCEGGNINDETCQCECSGNSYLDNGQCVSCGDTKIVNPDGNGCICPEEIACTGGSINDNCECVCPANAPTLDNGSCVCNVSAESCGNRAFDSANCECGECQLTAATCASQYKEFDSTNCQCGSCLSGYTQNGNECISEQPAKLDGPSSNGHCGKGYIKITKPEQLAKIGKDSNYPLSESYCLMNDINLTSYSSGEGWEPIGSKDNPFKGIFDGNEYKIYNLKINRYIDDYNGNYPQALFAANDGTITNLAVNGDVYGVSAIAILTGYNNGTISNSHVSGYVYAEDWASGGIAAFNLGKIRNSYVNDITVYEDWSHAGAFVGQNKAGALIENCYVNNASITGGYLMYSGAFTAYNAGTINNSYVQNSTIVGDMFIGGFVESNYGEINNSYTTVNVPYCGMWSPCESFVAENSGTIKNSYFKESYNYSVITANKAIGVTEDTMKSAPSGNIYVDWSKDVWCFSCSDYPVLKNMPKGAPSATSCVSNDCHGCANNASYNSSKSACECMKNYYGNGTTGCTACPAGMISDAGSTSKSSCKCPANYYGTTSTGCTACPDHASSQAGSSSCKCTVGYYGDGKTYCNKCPGEHVTSAMGSTSVTSCRCESGYYKKDSEDTCTICPLNHYCEYDKLNDCPSNAPLTTQTGRWYVSQCISCSDINSAKPYWTGTECVSCASYDINKPVWYKNSCVACSDTMKPIYKNGTCVACASVDSTKPYWDGEKCTIAPDNQTCDTNGKCVLKSAVGTCKAGYIAISNVGQLATIGNDSNYPLNGKYCLMNDIDLSSYSSGEGWAPIGSSDTPFNGIFDGNGRKITNLFTNRASANYQGLFGYSNGTIQNLGVSGSVNGNTANGLLAAYSAGTIANSYATGQVQGIGAVGGLVGINSGSIDKSYVYDVMLLSNPSGGGSTSFLTVGGFVGTNYSNITNSYARNINIAYTFFDIVGGFAGFNSAGTISNCYVTGEMETLYDGGGFAAQNYGTINNCYASVKIKIHACSGMCACSSAYSCSPASFVQRNDGGIITSSYYNSTLSSKGGCSYNKGTCDVAGYTTEQLQTSSAANIVYKGWSTSNWCFSCSDLPVLKNMPDGAVQSHSPDACKTDCPICPSNSADVYPLCDCSANEDVPAYNLSKNICSTCYDIDPTKPHWTGFDVTDDMTATQITRLKKECVACAVSNRKAPYWNGSECVSCYDNNPETPYWNGSECMSCASATDSNKPLWKLTCPEGATQNGSICETPVSYDCKFKVGDLCLVEIVGSKDWVESDEEDSYNFIYSGNEDEEFIEKYNLGSAYSTTKTYMDYWAGAAKYCQDKGLRLPTSDELLKIANEIYGTDYTCEKKCRVSLNSDVDNYSCCDYDTTDFINNIDLFNWLGYEKWGGAYLYASETTSSTKAYAREIYDFGSYYSWTTRNSSDYSALCVTTSDSQTIQTKAYNEIDYICAPCSNNTAYDEDAHACVCDKGYYGESSDSCTKCPDRKTTAATGAIDISECVCDNGYYSNNGECDTCPSNSYCDGFEAISCPADKPVVADNVVPGSLDDCVTCYDIDVNKPYWNTVAKKCEACPQYQEWSGGVDGSCVYVACPTGSTGTEAPHCTCNNGIYDADLNTCLKCSEIEEYAAAGKLYWDGTQCTTPPAGTGDNDSDGVYTLTENVGTCTAGMIPIYNAKQLADINNSSETLSASYCLMNDIDLSSYKDNGGWTPIGGYPSDDMFAELDKMYDACYDDDWNFVGNTSNCAYSSERELDRSYNQEMQKMIDASAFIGIFDGNNHTISNVVINNSEIESAGLFGHIDNAEIRNLGINNATIVTGEYVGGLVGMASDSSIKNVHADNVKLSGSAYTGGISGIAGGTSITDSYSSGIVSDGSQATGGIVGYVSGEIENCHSSATILGANTFATNVGGLAGRADYISVTNSYATGDVSGYIAGGLVGEIYEETITNCYATGSVNAVSNAGGLIGMAWNSNKETSITNSYAISDNIAGGTAGGLVGSARDSATITNSFASITKLEGGTIGGLIGNSDSIVINKCYANTKDIIGNDQYSSYSGGLVGFVSEKASISNSYAIVNNISAVGSPSIINFDSMVGGLVGKGYGSTTIDKSYAVTGNMSGSAKNFSKGGIIGNSGNVTNSYYDKTTSGQSDTGKGIGLTTDQMYSSPSDKVAYQGWSTENWCFSCAGYPVLKNMPKGAPSCVEPQPSQCKTCGGGSEGDYPECQCLVANSEYNNASNACAYSCPAEATGTHPSCDCSAVAGTPCYDSEANICTTCELKSLATPVWGGTACVTCAAENAATPVYDDLQGVCTTCDIATNGEKSFWNGVECVTPSKTACEAAGLVFVENKFQDEDILNHEYVLKYREIFAALKQAYIQHNIDTNYTYPHLGGNTSNNLENMFAKYMSGDMSVKKKYQSGLYGSTYNNGQGAKTLNGSGLGISRQGGILLENGAMISISTGHPHWAAKPPCQTWVGEYNGSLWIDVNGENEGPNILGKDIYYVIALHDDVYPWPLDTSYSCLYLPVGGWTDSTNARVQANLTCNLNDSTGYGCAAWFLENDKYQFNDESSGVCVNVACPSGSMGVEAPNCKCSEGVYDADSNACLGCSKIEEYVTAGKIYWNGTQCTTPPAGTGDSDGDGAYTLTKDVGTCQAGYIAISTADELAKIGVDASYPLDGKYCLMNNISLSNYYSNGGWTPIGSVASSPFTGTFNGNNHKISYLYIDKPNLDGYSAGLFSEIEDATILNTDLSNVNITAGSGAVGGLVGVQSRGTITNCSVSGSIVGIEDITVGGLVGFSDNGKITSS